MNVLVNVDHVDVAFSESAQTVLKVIAAVIMFSVALELRPADLIRVLRRPVAIAVGVLAQFVVLPLASVLLVKALDVRPSIALGMILVACCPPGKISNLLTLRAHGDTALSVSMTLVSNVASLAALPFAFPLWVGLDDGAEAMLADIDVSTGSVLAEVLLVAALPLGLGLLVAVRFASLGARFRPWLSQVGLAALLLLVAASVGVNWSAIVGSLGAVFLLVLIQDAIAFGLGYLTAAAIGLAPAGRRAMTFEVGVRNAGLGLVIVFGFFDGLGGMALVVAWWSVWDILAGLAIARWWSKKPTPVTPILDPV